MEEIIQIIAAFFSSVAFALLYNIKGKKVVYAGLAGMLGWALYILIGMIHPNQMIQYFGSAVFVTFFSEHYARYFKTPSTVFLSPGIIPFVPGAGLYHTMTFALNGQFEMFTEKGLETITIAGSIAAGVMAASSINRITRGAKRFNRRKREREA